jgi:hypothetical protein
MIARLEELLGHLQLQGQDVQNKVSGCSPADIAELESTLGFAVPEAYRRFMLVAGRNAGPVLAGTDCSFPRVLVLREWAEELLNECHSDYSLPTDYLVFSMHQGYEFLAMRLGAGDDPPVLQYVEGQAEPTEEWDSFSSYLADVQNESRRIADACPPEPLATCRFPAPILSLSISGDEVADAALDHRWTEIERGEVSGSTWDEVRARGRRES